MRVSLGKSPSDLKPEKNRKITNFRGVSCSCTTSLYILDVEDFGNSRDVEGLADPEDAVLDAEVDETVPATPHDGVVHYGCLTEIRS